MWSFRHEYFNNREAQTSRIRASYLLIGLFACYAQLSHALDGNDINRACIVQGNPSCQSYFHGIIDGYNLAIADFAAFKSMSVKEVHEVVTKICAPAGTSFDDEAAVAIQYVSDHPELRHLPASYLVIDSWREAWPCD